MTDVSAYGSPADHHDSEEITLDQAVLEWVPFAYEALKNTAERFNALITRDALAEYVQAESGISTDEPHKAWLQQVISLSAARAASQGEPPIASVCIRNDGTIGATYAKLTTAPTVEAVERATGTRLVDLERDVDLYAAEHRLLCYRTFAKDVPDDAVATLPPVLALRRIRADARAQRQAQTARAEAPRPVCMSCFTQLPANGVCSHCDL